MGSGTGAAVGMVVPLAAALASAEALAGPFEPLAETRVELAVVDDVWHRTLRRVLKTTRSSRG
ncbi:MAG TPA: hypothetical protein VHU77_04840 [Candidatus Limnocylindria bacterium]|nr:hypothetical protein [Candidatus Limnocylindria bacterium]